MHWDNIVATVYNVFISVCIYCGCVFTLKGSSKTCFKTTQHIKRPKTANLFEKIVSNTQNILSVIRCWYSLKYEKHEQLLTTEQLSVQS